MSNRGLAEAPTVSVVVPTHNSGWCIEVAANSVLAQTFCGLEIIIVDDGSTDDTRSRIAAMVDSRIRYFYQHNAGRSAARNRGISEARGKYVAFLDADDLWLPGKLEAQLALFHRYPSAIMAYCPAYSFSARSYKDGSVPDVTSGLVRGSGLPGCGDRVGDFLLQQLVVFTPTVMVTRDALTRIGGFDTRYQTAEDLDLYIRIALIGPVAYDVVPLAAVWRHYSSYVDWMRKYGGHHEQVKVIRNAVALPKVVDHYSALTSEAICAAEWSASLIDVDLGNLACAAQHIDACVTASRKYLHGEHAAMQAAERVLDTLGRRPADSKFRSNLRALIDGVTPHRYRASLYAKATAYFQAEQAFVAYEQGDVWHGLRLAARAALHDARWLSNRGLWTTPLRMFFSRRTGISS